MAATSSWLPIPRRRPSRARSARAVDVALEAIGELSWKPQRFRDLSEGMRRQVGLAQAFLGNPCVVLLDEPTNGLDESALQALKRLIDSRRSRTTIVLASHDTGVLERWCDRVLRMTKGRFDARDSSPESLPLEQGAT